MAHGARQITVRAHHCTHDVKHDQVKRELLAPGFGASGTVKIQGGDISHRQPGGKQPADRSAPGMFIGVTPNHKCIVVLQDERTMVTSDVQFPAVEPETPRRTSAGATPDDAWMAPVDAVFEAMRPPQAASTPSKAAATDESDGHASNVDLTSVVTPY